MTAPRDQVVCRQCGAVLGKVNSLQGHRKHNHMTLRHDVVMVVVLAVRVDIICPECGYCRGVRVEQFPVIQRAAVERAA